MSVLCPATEKFMLEVFKFNYFTRIVANILKEIADWIDGANGYEPPKMEMISEESESYCDVPRAVFHQSDIIRYIFTLTNCHVATNFINNAENWNFLPKEWKGMLRKIDKEVKDHPAFQNAKSAAIQVLEKWNNDYKNGLWKLTGKDFVDFIDTREISRVVSLSVMENINQIYPIIEAKFDNKVWLHGTRLVDDYSFIRMICGHLTAYNDRRVEELLETSEVVIGYLLFRCYKLIEIIPVMDLKSELIESHALWLDQLGFTRKFQKLMSSTWMQNPDFEKFMTQFLPKPLVSLLISYDMLDDEKEIPKRLNIL